MTAFQDVMIWTNAMVVKSLLLAGTLLAMAFPVQAQDPEGSLTAVSFRSASPGRSYGLLLAAPDSGCRHVRFRVEGARLLGKSPPLGPGELAVVRLGAGFPEGENNVTVTSVGCDAPPAAMRRVVLAKVAPDHGWRAGGN